MKWLVCVFVSFLFPFFLSFLLFVPDAYGVDGGERRRALDLGLQVGVLSPGALNMITDVPGVKVGHVTRIEGNHIRTGVTTILPHGGNLFQQKVPAAIYCFNSFGKMAGSLQVEELGNIETPIVLTNTLNVGTAVDAVVGYMLRLEGNEGVRSVNALVGETNDGFLNDIRGQHVTAGDVIGAIESAKAGVVQEGSVGAGTGTTSFGWKSGIGTASRMTVPIDGHVYTVGVLVQSNFGRILYIHGKPFVREPQEEKSEREEDGSAMIIIATDAPLSDRNLKRMAKRSFMGMGRTTNYMSNSSGDFAIAFSTAYTFPHGGQGHIKNMPALVDNHAMNTLFQAVEEATQEAIYNALFMAVGMTGNQGNRVEAIPLHMVKEFLQQ